MAEPSTGREHLVYAHDGEPEECTEDCPGCHWEGNIGCEALRSGCDLCDPDGNLFFVVDQLDRARALIRKLNREAVTAELAVQRAHDALDALSRETGAYEAGYKSWAQQVISKFRAALDGA